MYNKYLYYKIYSIVEQTGVMPNYFGKDLRILLKAKN